MIKRIYRNYLKLKNINKCKFYGNNHCFDKATFFEGLNEVFDETTLINCKLGLASYVGQRCVLKNTKIGRFCSIGDEVLAVVGNHPTTKFVSTYPAFYSKAYQGKVKFVNTDKFNKYKYLDPMQKISIIIGNDVWIGSRVSILEGVEIGDGAIIAAGAVVTKKVPPYAIVGGVPAHIIKYRFTEEKIEWLLHVQWWYKDYSWICRNAEYFDNIDAFMSMAKFGGDMSMEK